MSVKSFEKAVREFKLPKKRRKYPLISKVAREPSMNVVLGKGVNDADYYVSFYEEGERVVCPYYVKWTCMLRRAYNKDYHKTHPTYREVEVCKEWLFFMCFRRWMEGQQWEGKHLDKDLKEVGSKEYSPRTCCFVQPYFNTFFSGTRAAGVYKRGNTYKAQIKFNGVTYSLGYFTDKEEAREIHGKNKRKLVSKLITLTNSSEVIAALERQL